MTQSTTTNQQTSDDILDIENEFKEIIDRSPYEDKQPWDKHFDMRLMWSFFAVNKQLNQALKQADEEIVHQLEMMDKQDCLNACQKDINKAFVLLKHASLAKKHSLKELLYVIAKHETLALALLNNEDIKKEIDTESLAILCEHDSAVEMVLNDQCFDRHGLVALGTVNPKFAQIILADKELLSSLDDMTLLLLCKAHLEFAQKILADRQLTKGFSISFYAEICGVHPEVKTLLSDYTIEMMDFFGSPLPLNQNQNNLVDTTYNDLKRARGLLNNNEQRAKLNDDHLYRMGVAHLESAQVIQDNKDLSDKLSGFHKQFLTRQLGFFEIMASALREISVTPETTYETDAENSTLKPSNKKMRLN